METFIAHLTSNNAQIRNIDDIFDNVQGLCNENNEWGFFLLWVMTMECFCKIMQNIAAEL